MPESFLERLCSFSMNASELPVGLVETIGTDTTHAEASERLAAAIESHEKFGLVARVEHSGSAERIGLDLVPMTEFLFGNPSGGTPLMQISPTAGIDLPQKMLIIETDTGVRVLHNDPAYVAERHNIPLDTPQIVGAVGLLQALADIAAGV